MTLRLTMIVFLFYGHFMVILTYRPLSLGKQLCGHWKPQVFLALPFLHMPFVSLFLQSSRRSILLLHEQAWPCSSLSLDMLGSTNTADGNFGIGC
jgi:hypothetical protein